MCCGDRLIFLEINSKLMRIVHSRGNIYWVSRIGPYLNSSKTLSPTDVPNTNSIKTVFQPIFGCRSILYFLIQRKKTSERKLFTQFSCYNYILMIQSTTHICTISPLAMLNISIWILSRCRGERCTEDNHEQFMESKIQLLSGGKFTFLLNVNDGIIVFFRRAMCWLYMHYAY